MAVPFFLMDDNTLKYNLAETQSYLKECSTANVACVLEKEGVKEVFDNGYNSRRYGCVRMLDDSIQCIGHNRNGELGTGETSNIETNFVNFSVEDPTLLHKVVLPLLVYHNGSMAVLGEWDNNVSLTPTLLEDVNVRTDHYGRVFLKSPHPKMYKGNSYALSYEEDDVLLWHDRQCYLFGE